MTQETPVYGIPPDLVRGPEVDQLSAADEANWAMNWAGMDELRELAKDGEGFNIGIVDTGIDSDHPAIQPNFAGAKDFTGSSRGFRDVNGHGTHCSATVGAVMKNIGVGNKFRVWHGKGLSDSGSGSMSALLNAISYCAENNCRVISCSWGGGGGLDTATLRLFRELADRGYWLIFAGGNSGPNTPDTDWPGRSEYVTNVAAIDRNLRVASFSSAGAKIDISGPGVGIISARPGGGWQEMSGTSMATPWIAGVCGLYMNGLRLTQQPIPKVHELRSTLFNRATDTHVPGDDNRTGPGYLAPILLATALTPLPPHTGRKV